MAFSSAYLEKTGTSNLPLQLPDHHPDEDDLLVFYVPAAAYPGLIEKVRQTGATELPAQNPYRIKMEQPLRTLTVSVS